MTNGRSSIVNKDVFLVGCSESKRAEASPAEELYTSSRFRLCREVAHVADSWYVLSAKHGLMAPATQVKPYDRSIGDLTTEERQQWTTLVVSQIAKAVGKDCTITFLCDTEYSSAVSRELIEKGFSVRLPFDNRTRSGKVGLLQAWLCDTSRADDLSVMYAELSRLAHGLGEFTTLQDCRSLNGIPGKGIYLFFEDNEKRFIDNNVLRVVRVGTHAVSKNAKSTLWGRMRTHLGTSDGGGSHRSSIMRLHIGRALLECDRPNAPHESWGIGQSASKKILTSEKELEASVSKYISKMRVLWLNVPDEPGPNSDRAFLEQNLIGLLAGQTGPVDVGTSDWLGYWSPHPAIKRSQLWNVDYTEGSYRRDFLGVLTDYVSATIGEKQVPGESIAPQDWYDVARGRVSKGQMGLF